MDPLYPERVTYWHRLPDEGRGAVWERVDVPEAHVECQVGRSRLVGGDAAADQWLLMVPARHAGLCAWAAGDRFSLGADASDAPPAGAMTVTYAEPVRLLGRTDHVEMGGS